MTTAPRPVPRYSLRPHEAATALGISLSEFNEMVRDGHFSKPFHPPGRPHISLYLAREIEEIAESWRGGGTIPNQLDQVK